MFFFETAIICFIGIETSAEQGRVCRHRSALVVEGVWRCQLVAMDERVATVYVHCLCSNIPTLILSCRLLVTVSMVWGDHRSAALFASAASPSPTACVCRVLLLCK